MGRINNESIDQMDSHKRQSTKIEWVLENKATFRDTDRSLLDALRNICQGAR